MMQQPLKGVRVLEVAQYAFVSTAGAVLADWGAEVIKVEHAVRGDAQRGLVQVMGVDAFQRGSSFSPAVDGPNRGKRSVGLALDNLAARDVLHELIRRADVFTTNYLPGPRERLGLELEQVREINPDIIYVRGTGFGTQGPEADKGGFDTTTFWSRGGSAAGATPSTCDWLVSQPSAAYGDSMGGLTIAGGIAAALYARATTGEPSVVDVSLIAVGAWASNFSVNLALQNRGPLPSWYVDKRTAGKNPLVGNYQTADGSTSRCSSRESTGPSSARSPDALTWPPTVTGAQGNPQQLLANPVQFDQDPPNLRRAPECAEHTDDVLRELGVDDERLIDLKIAGAIT